MAGTAAVSRLTGTAAATSTMADTATTGCGGSWISEGAGDPGSVAGFADAGSAGMSALWASTCALGSCPGVAVIFAHGAASQFALLSVVSAASAAILPGGSDGRGAGTVRSDRSSAEVPGGAFGSGRAVSSSMSKGLSGFSMGRAARR